MYLKRKLAIFFYRIKVQDKPIRFICSRLLLWSGVCRLFLIKMNGYKLRFYPTTMSCGLWEDKHLRQADDDFIDDYVKSGDTVIDIGSNIGSIAILAATKVGHNGRVFAFEPHPRIFNYLTKNIKLNSLNNIKCYNFALGEKKGSIYFANDKLDDMNGVSDNNNKNTIKVDIEKLDNVIPLKQNIALIKIDVEGYEKFVLEGAHTILPNIECIYFESSEWHFEKYNYSSLDLFNLITSYGYRIYSIMGSRTISMLNKNHISKKGEDLIAIKNIDKFISRTGYQISH